VATKAKSKTRRKTQTRGESTRTKLETGNPKVARMTIEIDWDELVARVAKQMGKKAKKMTGGSRRTRRKTTRSAASR